MGNRPEKVFRHDGITGMNDIQIVGWGSRMEGFKTFNIKKSYKDKETGQWKESKQLTAADFIKLLPLMNRAIAWSQSVNELIKDGKDPEMTLDKDDVSDTPFG